MRSDQDPEDPRTGEGETPPGKHDLAQARTDWAEDRTILANERSFASWMRTGLACLAVALGLKALFRPFEPTWMARSVAEIFVLAALVIFWLAYRRAVQTRVRMSEHAANGQSRHAMATISGLMVLGALGTGALLWWL
jgi:putative membrane protein